MYRADPHNKHPLAGFPRVCFIKNTVSNPKIIIGDYTYYDDPIDSENFERNVLYHFGEECLIIGKFCALGTGVQFIMNGANHSLSGFSTYPFYIFGNGWENFQPEEFSKGDMIVGNDVWIGYDSLIMPGVKIGDGAVIGARSVVTRDVEPYGIVGGNPARLIRKRFSEEIIEELLAIAWWDWEIEKITQNLEAIIGADMGKLKNCLWGLDPN
jgi:virginiamycin A acetyltransferase